MFEFNIYDEFPIIGIAKEKSESQLYTLIGILKITECKITDMLKHIDTFPYETYTYAEYYAGSFICNEIKSAYNDLKDRFYPKKDEIDNDNTKQYIMNEFNSLGDAIRNLENAINDIWVGKASNDAFTLSNSDDEKSVTTEEGFYKLDELDKPFDFKQVYRKLPILKYYASVSDDENDWDYDSTMDVVNNSIDMADEIYHRADRRILTGELTSGEFFAICEIHDRLSSSVRMLSETTIRLLYCQNISGCKSKSNNFENSISNIIYSINKLGKILFDINIDPGKIEALK